MSLVFAGSYAAFHHQYFKMVDMMMHHFEQNMYGLNPHARSYVPAEQEYTEKNNNSRDEDSVENDTREEGIAMING